MQRSTTSTLLTIGLGTLTLAVMAGLVVLPVLDVFDGSAFVTEFWENTARFARAGTVGVAALLLIAAMTGFVATGPGELVSMIGDAAAWIMALPTWIFVVAGIALPPDHHDVIRMIGIQPAAIGPIYFVGTFVAIALAFGTARVLAANEGGHR